MENERKGEKASQKPPRKVSLVKWIAQKDFQAIFPTPEKKSRKVVVTLPTCVAKLAEIDVQPRWTP